MSTLTSYHIKEHEMLTLVCLLYFKKALRGSFLCPFILLFVWVEEDRQLSVTISDLIICRSNGEVEHGAEVCELERVGKGTRRTY